jgi:hypothetical protein
MDLWVVSIISNPQIKKDFYSWTTPRDELVFIQQEPVKTATKLIKRNLPPLIITNTAELVLGGLFSAKG